MISAPDLSQAQLDSPLGRTSPVVKLAVAIGWLVALAFTLEPFPPVGGRRPRTRRRHVAG